MDKSLLVKKLNRFFCDVNRTAKRYSKVWLSEVDFGGLYYTDEFFVLNVVAENDMRNRYAEIKEIIALLNYKAKEELQAIWKVAVYNPGEPWRCEFHDSVVYTKEDACNA